METDIVDENGLSFRRFSFIALEAIMCRAISILTHFHSDRISWCWKTNSITIKLCAYCSIFYKWRQHRLCEFVFPSVQTSCIFARSGSHTHQVMHSSTLSAVDFFLNIITSCSHLLNWSYTWLLSVFFNSLVIVCSSYQLVQSNELHSLLIRESIPISICTYIIRCSNSTMRYHWTIHWCW